MQLDSAVKGVGIGLEKGKGGRRDPSQYIIEIFTSSYDDKTV